MIGEEGHLELTEKKLDSTLLHEGRVIKLFLDQVALPNGKTASREVVRHPGGVIILPLGDDGFVYLVRQFRYPLGKAILEIPAGKLEYGEEPLPAAQRELKEEIGAEAKDWVSLGDIWPTPGFCDEVQHLYLARGLTFGQTQPDEDEFLEQVKLPFSQVLAMAADGRMQDGKSVAAILRTHLLMEGERDG